MKLIPLILLCSLAARADVVLVRDGKEPLTIYTAAKPAPQERAAATELAKYLERLSGTAFAVKPSPSPAPDAGIFIGASNDAPATTLPPDAFKIEAAGKTVRLTGGSPQATQSAVFAWLEEQLGCRWWTHSEEDLPAVRATLSVPEMNRVIQPPFEIHNVWNREAQSPLNQFAAKARTTSATHFTGGHTLYPLLKEYGSTHPEIYPLNKDGQRKPNDLHFCYIAPGIAEALAEALAKQVEAKKGELQNTIYFAGMGDWYGGMCECEKCKAIYEEETWTDPDGKKKSGVSATLLRMINRTAELLDKRHPGIRVGTMAYMSLEAPPAKTVPRENVVIRVPRLRHCTVHPARTCESNASFARNVERWCQLAPGRVYIWEYATSFTHFLNPFPCLFSMADNLKFYHEQGIRGVEIQGNYVSLGGDMAAVKNYVWRKVFAQPQRDPHELLAEFCKGYFGPAGDDMIGYVEALEKSVVEPKIIHADEFAQPTYLTPGVRAAMEKHRDQALARVRGNETFERRIRETAIGLEATLLWKAGPLAEADGRLVRTDIPGDSLARAREMLKYIRGAGPNEFQSGPASHLALQALQGGPLVSLEHGALRVKMAPLINGQLRQITWQGRDLLHVESNARIKGFPLLGGSFDGAGTRIMQLEGEPSPTKVRMTGASGVGSFDSAPKQTIWKNVELSSERAIAITMDATQLAKTGSNQRGAAVTTAYATGKQPGEVRCEYQDEADQWHALALSAEQPEQPLPKLKALRIRLPAQSCTLLDRYISPAATGGKVVLNPKDATLTTTVNTTPVDAPLNGATRFLERRIEILP